MTDSKSLSVPDFVVLTNDQSIKQSNNQPIKQSINPSTNQYDYNHIAFRDLNKIQFYSLMFGFAVSIRCLTYPMTLIKTRQQSTNQPTSQINNQSIKQSIKLIVQNEGIRGLYRGLRLNLVTLSVSPVYITTLEMTRDALNQTIDHSNQPINQAIKQSVPFVSGLVGSIVGQSLAVPLDVITQRQMINQERTTASSIFRNLIARDGIMGLWRGYSLSLMSAAPYSAILWGVFHTVKGVLRDTFPDQSINQISNQSTNQISNQSSNEVRNRWSGYSREVLIVPISAACGSSLASVMTMPLDVMRTRIQTSTDKLTFSRAFRQLISERGWRGLMSGVTARVAAAAPGSALMMSAYELVKRICLVEEESER